MPIYEYRCEECGKISSFLTLSISQSYEPICSRCGSRRLKKLVSRVAVFRSEESRLESLADPAKFGDLDENDPRSLARWMKKMGRELGEDLGEDFEAEIDQAVEEAERAKERGEEGEESSDEATSSEEF